MAMSNLFMILSSPPLRAEGRPLSEIFWVVRPLENSVRHVFVPAGLSRKVHHPARRDRVRRHRAPVMPRHPRVATIAIDDVNLLGIALL